MVKNIAIGVFLMTKINKFPLVIGNPSIDLVNSEIVRRGERHDLLVSSNDLNDWLKVMQEFLFFDNQLSSLAQDRSDKVLSCLLEMRTILRKEYESIADGQPITQNFIAFLEKKIEKAPFTYKLLNDKLIPRPIGLIEDTLLSYISYDALHLIEKNKLSYLKHCSNPECVLLFVDESGRRKWCSMKVCGNRKKVTRFQNKINELDQ